MSATFRRGLVVGKFAPLHRGHQFLIEEALAQCEQLFLWTYSNPDFPHMTTPARMDWLRALSPQTHVLPEAPASPPNDASDETHQRYAADTLARWGVEVDVVFTSESYGAPFARRLGAAHKLVDLDRSRFPVSGTMVREDIHAHRSWLHPIVYGHFVEKVVFLGGESTGKTTLATRMAEVYQTRWIPEYGREVFQATGGHLEPHHFVEIARGHRDQEDRALRKEGLHRYLFCDTNAMTTALFSFMMTGGAEPELMRLAEACRSRYAHVFVCGDDLPFTQDGWRGGEAMRQAHQGLILYELAIRGIPAVVVRGDLETRVAQVRAVLDAG